MNERRSHEPIRADAVINGPSLALYRTRGRLSQREVGQRADPSKAPGAAQQWIRRIEGRGMTAVPRDTGDALGVALSVDPEWLNSEVVYVPGTGERKPLAIAGGVLVWTDEAACHAAAVLIGESGLFERPEPFATTRAEVESLLAAGRDRVVGEDDFGWEAGTMDDVRTLVEVERYLRGAGAVDYIAWNFPALVFNHLTPVFRETPRGDEKDRLARLIKRAIEIETDEDVWATLHDNPPSWTSREW